MHVLIIESDAPFAERLRDSLQLRGIDSSITEDGEAALALARDRKPAAVILALELGDRPSAGFSWCNRFKRDDVLRSIPLVLTSALATPETIDHHKRLKTRADAYLIKPFEPEALLGELSTLLPLDGPPAGSIASLADELLPDGIGEPETLDAEEISEIPADDLAAADEGLDELFSDLAPAEVDPNKTLVGFVRLDEEKEEELPAAVAPPAPAAPPPAPPAPVRAAPAAVDRHRAGGESALELAELRGRVAELEASLETSARELDERDRDLARMREIEARLRSVQQRADAGEVQNRKLEATLSALRADAALVPELEERIARLEADAASTRQSWESTASDLETARAELAQTQDELASTRSELETTRLGLASTREELEGTAAEAAETGVKLAEALGRITDLEGELDARAASEAALRERLRESLAAAARLLDEA